MQELIEQLNKLKNDSAVLSDWNFEQWQNGKGAQYRDEYRLNMGREEAYYNALELVEKYQKEME